MRSRCVCVDAQRSEARSPRLSLPSETDEVTWVGTAASWPALLPLSLWGLLLGWGGCSWELPSQCFLSPCPRGICAELAWYLLQCRTVWVGLRLLPIGDDYIVCARQQCCPFPEMLVSPDGGVIGHRRKGIAHRTKVRGLCGCSSHSLLLLPPTPLCCSYSSPPHLLFSLSFLLVSSISLHIPSATTRTGHLSFIDHLSWAVFLGMEPGEHISGQGGSCCS